MLQQRVTQKRSDAILFIKGHAIVTPLPFPVEDGGVVQWRARLISNDLIEKLLHVYF